MLDIYCPMCIRLITTITSYTFLDYLNIVMYEIARGKIRGEEHSIFIYTLHWFKLDIICHCHHSTIIHQIGIICQVECHVDFACDHQSTFNTRYGC